MNLATEDFEAALWDDVNSTADVGAAPLSTGDLSLDARRRRAGPPTTDALPEVNVRGHERVPLDKRVVEARVEGESGSVIGRVADASLSGFWVDMGRPLAVKTPIHVELAIVGNREMSFRGRVMRASKTGMGVRLVADDLSWSFRQSFIDAALDPKGAGVQVRIRPATKDREDDRRREEDARAVGKKWMDVLKHLGDDATHQAFITECIRRRRLDYATERYRELKSTGDYAEVTQRYLDQLGKVLAFSALSRKPNEKKSSTLSKKLIMLGAVVAMALAALAVAADRIKMEPAAPPQADVIQMPSSFTKIDRR